MDKPSTPLGLKCAWKEYPSIDNANRRLLSKVSPQEAEGRWVALEKVHGSNFCFITNGTELLAARRNALLDPVETFYSWQVVRAKYESAFHALHQLVLALPDHSDVTEVCVFGELFGGVYPHPEVEDLGHQPVQKGVFYTPDLEFYAFDIQVVRPAATATSTAGDDDGEGEGEGGVVKSWLDYDRATKLFAASGLFYARPLVEGTLAECFAYDIRINSTLPGLLGLPPLEQNQIEGIVIKSVHNVGLAMGKRYQGGSGPRAIFKKKNARFEEVNPKCETKWEEQRRVKKAAIDTVYDEVERYITINRLHNLESKMGPVTRDNASEAATALAADAMKDLVRDYEETWAVIEEASREVVHKNVRSKAAQWLNDHLAATSDV